MHSRAASMGSSAGPTGEELLLFPPNPSSSRCSEHLRGKVANVWAAAAPPSLRGRRDHLSGKAAGRERFQYSGDELLRVAYFPAATAVWLATSQLSAERMSRALLQLFQAIAVGAAFDARGGEAGALGQERHGGRCRGAELPQHLLAAAAAMPAGMSLRARAMASVSAG